MSANNPFGIFASTVSHNVDLSVKALRAVVTSDAIAERIVQAAAVTCSLRDGYTVDENIAHIREQAAGCQLRVAPRIALAMSALCAVESAYTVYHAAAGSEEGLSGGGRINDTREAGEVAYAVLMAA